MMNISCRYKKRGSTTQTSSVGYSYHFFSYCLIYVLFDDSVPLLTKYFSGNQIEKNEMGGACSTYGGEERCMQDFGGET
jgi:hypothetical protein